MPMPASKVVEEVDSSGGEEMLEDDGKSHELYDDYDSSDEMFHNLNNKYRQKQ